MEGNEGQKVRQKPHHGMLCGQVKEYDFFQLDFRLKNMTFFNQGKDHSGRFVEYEFEGTRSGTERSIWRLFWGVL